MASIEAIRATPSFTIALLLIILIIRGKETGYREAVIDAAFKRVEVEARASSQAERDCT